MRAPGSAVVLSAWLGGDLDVGAGGLSVSRDSIIFIDLSSAATGFRFSSDRTMRAPGSAVVLSAWLGGDLDVGAGGLSASRDSIIFIDLSSATTGFRFTSGNTIFARNSGVVSAIRLGGDLDTSAGGPPMF
eukprot:Gregarina_sp_Poly_1__3422@NODE_1994_length_2909_cov_18_463758_g1287_i0_p3_GENE_NODE_1994_length_2909_cov_18_463758_g1287_i0NODE_1994_length_2909_cov_18_463758_g1287_i0_p3_ORF_typecomplete_len131_score13_55DUF3882/PF07066_11/20DUF3882/PF07066_11/6_2BHD_3/PF10405_9/43BHD_3/PF10405_9/8_6DUF2198/PF09964_9/34DUF2198/PF09964_9/20_NODE_1994_length_2909_cov_18_463758_g1287_i014371829